jgi:hypothetical protein
LGRTVTGAAEAREATARKMAAEEKRMSGRRWAKEAGGRRRVEMEAA